MEILSSTITIRLVNFTLLLTEHFIARVHEVVLVSTATI